MKMKTLACLLLATTQASALSLTPINQDPIEFDVDAHDMGNSQPVLLNDRILFAGRANGGNALWAMDINTLEKTVLQEGFAINGKIEFMRVGDEVLFKFNEDVNSGSKLWISDGTAAGTRLFLDRVMSNFVPLTGANGLVFGETDEFNPGPAQYVVTDGQNTVIHHAEPTYSEQICAHNTDVILLHDRTGDVPVYRRSTATESAVLDIPVTDEYFSYQPDLVAHDGNCYVVVYDGENTRGGDLWEIDETGQINNISEQLEFDLPVRQVLSHNGSLYIQSYDIENQIHLLNNELTEVVAAAASHDSPTMFSSGPFLVAMTFPATSPPSIVLSFLSSDLSTQTGSSAGYRGPSPHRPPDFFATGDKWLMAQQLYVGQSEPIKSLVFEPFAHNEKVLPLPQTTQYHVITSPHQDSVFLMSLDQTSRGTLFAVENTPSMGSVVDGSWIVPNINNQGLMLRTGQRQDGSEYLIATVYTFQDGQPFWLAGVADIPPMTPRVELDVFAYEGLDFFEPDTEPTRTPFGQLTLELTSCQSLAMELTAEDVAESHTLLRVDDVKATPYCVD